MKSEEGIPGEVLYESEIKEILSEFYEPWMDEKDKREFNELMLQSIGGIQKLSDDIHVGVCNGYSVEFQMNMVKLLLSNST